VASFNRRMDRVEDRLERIERRVGPLDHQLP
jgi:hypothetical protein